MIWAYDTRSGNAVQMIGRGASTPGTCSAGCWPEKQSDGRIICVCSDTLFKPRFLQRRSLSGGVWEGAAMPVAAVLATAAAAFGAVYWFRMQRSGRR